MSQKPRRILVVEDDDKQREMYARLLEHNDYQVEVAGTVAEALRKAALIRPDAILMDVMLPDGSGLAAVQTIKAEPQLQRVPVICMTAYHLYEDRALARGFDGFLEKPFDGATMVEAIETAITTAEHRL